MLAQVSGPADGVIDEQPTRCPKTLAMKERIPERDPYEHPMETTGGAPVANMVAIAAELGSLPKSERYCILSAFQDDESEREPVAVS